MAKVAINGFGRIGRAAFKILLETPGLELAAINDLVPPDNLAYLLKYDTVYGRYEKEVSSGSDHIIVDGRRYPVLKEKDPARLPWKDRGVDIVLECTGLFTRQEDMAKHIEAGARSVILSAPSKSEEVMTVVYGANKLAADAVKFVSCASCTTNSITPVVEIIGRKIGIRKAIMTTVHAYTSTQSIVDTPNKKMRRGRAGAANFVPTSTGAAIATARALPQYKGKFDGVAIRGPVPVGSISDIVMVTERKTTVEEINSLFEEEARSERYSDVISVCKDEIVSSDIIKDPHAAVIDVTMTKVVDGDLVKVMAWYDNEWGYSNQLIRQTAEIAKLLEREKVPAGAV